MSEVAVATEVKCDLCGSANMRKPMLPQKILYGQCQDQVTLECVVPVFCCNDCGEMYTDYEAEDIRDQAVRTYRESIAPN